MSVSQAYKLLWSMGIVAALFPHLHTGLLSDYKICGDSECQSLMSRVQAIRDHLGKDCRFLSFRRGDTIFVYHKLTGKRDDLWAGSIDKQFGHFPKDAVKEEHLYATVERVVETQNSDFFCVDEFGYPIDSSHLDSDDEEDGDRVQNQDPETAQPTLYLDDNNAESPSTSGSISTESHSTADVTQTELDKNTNTAAAETPEETQEGPSVSKEQGGSASSAWLGSTVTGLLGLAKEEESANLAEGERKEVREETQDEAPSFTASVTGWLGMGGGGGKTDDEVKHEEEDREDNKSFTSTMTGWLGFGGEKKPEKSAEKEDDKERHKHEEQEPADTFKSRRMSLDLEGSQLQEEERAEMGTLDWLGNDLSNILGFGRTNQRPEKEAEEIVKEEASGSWYHMGIGNILGYGNDKPDESIQSGFQEVEVDGTSDQPAGSENEDTGQLQAEQTEDFTTETTYESIIEEPPQEENILTEAETMPSTAEVGIIDAPDSSEDGDLSENTAAESEGGKSSTPDIFFQTSEEEDKHKVLEDRAADVAGDVHQTSEAAEDEGDDNNRQTKEEEIKAAEEPDQEMLTQMDTNLSSDSSSVDFKSDTAGQSVGGDKSENLVQESAQIQSQIDKSADEISTGGTNHEADMNNQGTGVEQSDTGAGRGSILSHDLTSNEQETLSQIGGNADPVFLSPDEQQTANQSDGDAQEQQEADQNSEIDAENLIEPAQMDTTGIEKYNLDDSGLTSSVGLETETEEESKEEKKEREMEEQKMEEQEEMKAQEKQKQMDEEKQDEVKELEEEQQGVKEVTEKEEPVELEDLKDEMSQEEAEEITEKERPHEIEKLKEEKTQLEVEEIQERKDLEELEELKGEKKEIKEDEEEVEMGESKEANTSVDEEVRQSEMKELKEDAKLDQVEEKQQYIEESEGDKQKEVEDLEERGHIEGLTDDGKEKKDDDGAEHDEQEMENVGRVESESREIESQEEKSLETPEQTESHQIEGVQKEEESQETQLMGEEEDAEENVKSEGRDRVEEGQDALERDSDEKDSMDEEVTEAEKPNPTADMTEESQTTSFEGMKRDEDSGQGEEGNEEERYDVVEANERKMENLDIRIIYTNTVSSLNSLEVDQTEKAEYMNSDLPHSVEDVQDSLSKTVSPEVTDTSQLYPSEVENTELTDDKVNYGGDKTDVENTEINSKGVSTEEETKQTISDHKREVGELNMKHNDGRVNEDDNEMTKTYQNTIRAEVQLEGEVLQSETVVSEQTFSHHPAGSSLSSDVPDNEKAENENGDAFDLFRNAFSYFGQTLATETERSTQSSQSLGSNTPETPEVQTFHTPEQLPDATTHSSQVYLQDLHLDTPNPLPEWQHPSPSPAQTPHSHPSAVSPNTKSPHLMKTIYKHYKNLHTLLSVDDTVILADLLGQLKLQFLDDILESSETMTGDPDTNESILLDVERLLHYHRELLVTPRGKLLDAPQEDKEKTKTLIALQKLEILLAKVRKTFSTGKPDSSNTNHQAEGSCDGESCTNLNKDKKMTAEEEPHKEVDSPVGTETNTPKGEWMGLDKEKDGKLRGDTEEQRVTEYKEERASPVSSPHSEPGTSQTLEGMMQQLLGFLYTMTEDSNTHIQAARELLIWLTVRVRVKVISTIQMTHEELWRAIICVTPSKFLVE